MIRRNARCSSTGITTFSRRSSGVRDSPPFEPTVRDGYFYARGAEPVSKGQILAHILGVEEALRSIFRSCRLTCIL